MEEPELDEPWRNFNWHQKSEMKRRLEKFTLSNPDVKHMKILVVGQIGAGKSSFINSVNSVCQGRITSDAPATSSSGHDRSFTKRLKEYYIGRGRIPLVFADTMGLAPEILTGAQPDDIIKAVCGHVRDGYEFDESEPITHRDQHFTDDPSLSEQAFCLVYVIDANTVSTSHDIFFSMFFRHRFNIKDDKLIDKLKIIRHRISARGIPQVVVMTNVDEVCPLVQNDLRKIYYSRKIRNNMHRCHVQLGVPMSNIFPVKNYHDEIDTNNDVDVLILKALEQIVHLANERLIERSYY